MKQKIAKLRIIAGQWRGRKLQFASDRPDMRPTANRVRETLFNFLTPYIDGAACLDLFAGSGALGLEAVSRGARCATLVEKDRQTYFAHESRGGKSWCQQHKNREIQCLIIHSHL